MNHEWTKSYEKKRSKMFYFFKFLKWKLRFHKKIENVHIKDWMIQSVLYNYYTILRIILNVVTKAYEIRQM